MVKRPAAHSFPSPKRGMLRLVLRRPAKKRESKPARDSVPYVPKDQVVDQKLRAEHRAQNWCASLLSLAAMTDFVIIKHMQTIGILPHLKTCLHCGHGKLSKLFKQGDRGYVQRCNAKGCQKFVLPHAHHPVFVTGWGCSYVPLQQQALALFCYITRVDTGKIHLLTGLGHKLIESLGSRWRKTLVLYVEKQQLSIQLGDGVKWSQCEVDEVTCRGKRQGNKVTWYQYCGLLRRGDRKSLILAKMKIKSTYVKRKGKGQGSIVSPGPISKAEWKPIADKFVKLRKILLHSDGARAYRFTKIPGVVTDSVKHKRPRPIYTALWRHVLPKDQMKAHTSLAKLAASEKETVWVKKGTQLIDNVWRQLKLIGLPKSTKAEDAAVHPRVREFQWHHWHAEDDKWLAAGKVFTSLANT